MEKVLPQLVYTESDMKSILYEDLIAILVAALAEQDRELQDVRREVVELSKSRAEDSKTMSIQNELINSLTRRIDRLEAKMHGQVIV